ncbi:hypothetical protein RB595_003505 [Gaeumannomyces hyphopodioides]
MLWEHCRRLLVSSVFGGYITCPARSLNSSSPIFHNSPLHPCQQHLCQASPISPHSPPPAMPRGAVIALSHGGGPMPLLGHPDSAQMTKSMRERVPEILRLNDPDPARRPAAIVLVTAHWVAPSGLTFPSITSGPRPDLIFDYYNFPPESYKYKYPAPGAPDLAARLAELARDQGLSPSLHPDRGYDHGVFVPLLLAHPAADVPVLQVSVMAGDDARAHFALGRALAALREERNVAVVGSGFASFHNLREIFAGKAGSDPDFTRLHRAWNAAMTDAVLTGTTAEREDKFAGWRDWPHAYVSHPANGAEHFMPLAVCAGAAGDGVAKSYVDEFMGLEIHSYYWD